jgi:signal transduction histidine kinase
VKAAVAILVVAIACLTICSLALLWRTGGVVTAAGAGAYEAALTDFEASERPEVVDLATRYAGRRDLLDPRLALPAWHKFPREDAVRVHVATKTCPPAPLAGVVDPSLAKAYAWHDKTCDPHAVATDDAIDRPPFLHPSGRSYAALALARGVGDEAASRAWAHAHARSFHVLELATLDPSALDPADRSLAALPARTWEALARGDRLILTPDQLVIAAHGAVGLTALRLYPRRAWETFAHRRSVALVFRGPSAACARPASSELCWSSISRDERNRPALLAGTIASASLVVLASFALGAAYFVERRRMHADRIHVLRTLTHELRTPATSLRLDIEPLRAAYDDLPLGCQEPLLRISDDIERLQRVLHRSARYMALFETAGATREQLTKIAEVPSVRALFEELATEWPEDVSLSEASADGAVRTDPEWLSVAVRNLVENAARHGKAPVAVSWAIVAGALVVRVSDAGATPSFSIRRAIAPYARDARSSGLGLGLAIVDRVARLLGGRLSHEPEPTVFELRLPSVEGSS